MRALPHVLAALLAIALIATDARAAVDLEEIDVQGGNAETRRITVQAIGDWSRASRTPDLEGVATAVGAALVREGWGRGEVSASFDSTGGGLRCRIRLQGIGPTRLARWQWEPDSGRAAIPSGTWQPARGEEEIDQVLSDVQEDGHPFASVQILSAIDTTGGLMVRAHLEKGRRMRLLQTIFEGRGATRPAYLERVSNLKRGDPIRPSDAERARDRIERTGLFADVAGPWLTGVTDAGASLVYRMTPLPQNRVEGAAGYDGSRRTLSGFVHVELGNLFGTGRRLNTSWDRYDVHRSALSLAYREPYLIGLPVAADVALTQTIEDTTWTSDGIRGAIEGDLGGGVTARIGLSRERTVGSYPGSSSRTSRVATILGTGYDGRSQAGTRGSRLDFEMARGSLERTPRLAEGEGTLTTIAMHGERNFLLGRRGHFRAECIGGWVEGPDSLPRPDAIGLGGGASLRGYPEQAFRTLGYGLARLEAGIHMLPEGNRVYIFLDGAVLRPWPSGAKERKAGYGFGLRVRGAGGWVRFDYGIPSGTSPLAGRIHFRLETRF